MVYPIAPALHISSLVHADRGHFLPSTNVEALLPQAVEEGAPCQGSLPPIFSALKVLDEFPHFREMLENFPAATRYAFMAHLLVPDRNQHRRLQVLEKLANKRSGAGDFLQAAGRVPLPPILEHESTMVLIEGMLAEKKTYRRELALLFTQLSVHRLPHHLNTAATSAALSLSLLPQYSGWFLCSSAENRLSRALYDGAVLLVNGCILLKFVGKLSGLALRTMTCDDGTQLIEGCWYSPVDYRGEIRSAFDQGLSRLDIKGGQWALIRSFDEEDHPSLLKEGQDYVERLPEKFPEEIQGRSRQEYRSYNYESFD